MGQIFLALLGLCIIAACGLALWYFYHMAKISIQEELDRYNRNKR
jgi:hypothetical protein